LLFYGGTYTVTEPAEPTPGILDNLITWSRDDDGSSLGLSRGSVNTHSIDTEMPYL
jgi:hypothetical protein